MHIRLTAPVPFDADKVTNVIEFQRLMTLVDGLEALNESEREFRDLPNMSDSLIRQSFRISARRGRRIMRLLDQAETLVQA